MATEDHGGQRLPPGAVDCHAHVMLRDAALVAERHSAPAFDFTLEDYLGLLDRHGVTSALLTAPSFYGPDNTLLLQALDAAGGRLRGTVIVDPAVITRQALAAMRDRGACGVRLNWIRRDALPDSGSDDYLKLFATLRDLDMHVEVFLEGELLERVVPNIQRAGPKIVIDHFGHPDPATGVRSAGFQYLLGLVAQGNTWVKLSAPYRQGVDDVQPYVDALLRAGGPQRLVWATDCPWVKFEKEITYRQCIDWMFQWVPDERARNQILVDTPRALFGFDR
ncbi:amidohydrolase family protein [Bordetella genomosp. 13]|uniref:amidohydrolase family protein n=1 Tax=Bordetella genomosp. 13 TaxID=463040 RepID=UPI0011A929CD|nr:amidohydrolase family protein [Bordetella genomosp. 13]